jgi:hypothetical protein
LKKKDFFSLGGSQLLNSKYNGSPYLLLSTVFPNYEWLPWKFDKCPQNYWDDFQNQLKFMNWVAKELNINENDDWYKISAKVFYSS